ncbi:GntR family transcriptional regulator [Nitrospirillum amazonense]|uniref:GntR family transcriptional regulator n=1 Tax=Nitrospirillum amazonense TaxID=28077 RepID=A0A560EQL4_9PROT|nr:GntR family transcriptional regulator [Nitrospirillum amazonense]TWB11555.1 GntR family transcriptional regulator [Nitrospirillum amazonense]
MIARAKIERKSLSAQVVDALRQMILSGEYALGAQLRQDEIAQKLGVSRIPVREALQQLEAEGLVATIPYKGSVVAQLSPAQVREYFEVRLLLEIDLLRRAIPQLTAKQIKRAEGVIKELHTAEAGRWGALNWQLHESLYEPAQRPVMLDMVKRIHDSLDRYVRLHLSMTPAIHDRSMAEHEQLVALCRDGKGDEAVEVLRGHLTHALEELVVFLEGQEAA